ncbi:MAG TPA: hypothetical protein VG028_18780 [Terriglobia bacterium]|nr:hypothetical protein [Terriglobia bacterium]
MTIGRVFLEIAKDSCFSRLMKNPPGCHPEEAKPTKDLGIGMILLMLGFFSRVSGIGVTSRLSFSLFCYRLPLFPIEWPPGLEGAQP